ncbi:unnamed protein product [Rotaria magnacalcarata]
MLNISPVLINCIERWECIQDPEKCTVSNLQNAISQLDIGDFLPLYFHAQNAAILIEMNPHATNVPFISSWQVLLPTEQITSSLLPHYSCFPALTFRLPDRSQLISEAHCELLIDFMKNTIQCAKSSRYSSSIDETRDIAVSDYVRQWWITHFQNVQPENAMATMVNFQKKHRDQIRWNDASLPFRRSGLWMTIKTVLHTITIKRLGRVGTIVYKLLITLFLTDIIYNRQHSVDCRISIDQLMHCLRKIVRRLNKIDRICSNTEYGEIKCWIYDVKDRIKNQLYSILPDVHWQNTLRRNEEHLHLSTVQSSVNRLETYTHTCIQLKTYTNQPFLSFHQASNSIDAKALTENRLSSVDLFIGQSQKDTGISLIKLEIWFESQSENYLNCSSFSASEGERYKKLSNYFETYQDLALQYYYSGGQSSDPIGYSRYVLTSLTIIRAMHKKLCSDERFNRLKHHAIRIPHLLQLFEFLVLPNRDDMARALELYTYFNEYNEKPYPDLLSSIESNTAFGIDFASRSTTMKESLQKIRAEAEIDKQAKINEVKISKKQYEELMREADGLSCECTVDYFPYKRNEICKRCKIRSQANGIKVHIYECPIPSKNESALAVMFELQMPSEIRCYREVLWQFVNRPHPKPTNRMHEWLEVRPHSTKLHRFSTVPNKCNVKLVSNTKSLTQSHYSAPRAVGSTPLEGFLFENSLKVEISPTKSTTFQDECRTLTPQLSDPDYKHLQFSIDSTKFEQNQVIAKLTRCPMGLTSLQFVEFGSFRSGHRLQWWNLLSSLEADSLSFDEESVVTLIMHSTLQYGPMNTDEDKSISSWCPASHQQLLNDQFVEQFILRLDRHLNDCKRNWQNEFVLVAITVITMRILTICASTMSNKMIDLALKCREIGELSIERISKILQNTTSVNFAEMEKLRNKIVIIATACLLTFFIQSDYVDHLLTSNHHIVSLLKSITSIHDNIILNKKPVLMSDFMKNLMRMKDYIMVKIQPTMSKFLKQTCYQSLNEFAATYWAVLKTKTAKYGNWKKRDTCEFDGQYDGQYESVRISIDCFKGAFLVNGMRVGYLPEEITSNSLFICTFGQHVFETQPAESCNKYITKHSYHDNKVYYEFIFDNRTRQLTIQERHQTGDIYVLIPNSCFTSEFCNEFVFNYSHWMNKNTRIIEFRAIDFRDPKFLINIPYVLAVDKGFLTTKNTEIQQILVNRSSTLFQNLFKHYFIRLDDEPYVYMFRECASPISEIEFTQTHAIIHIHLSRLGIAFKYDVRNNIIVSREYSEMHVDENQWFGTLTGLTAGLLLSPMSSINREYQHYLSRKLIVPFGKITVKRISGHGHQTVSIERNPSMSFAHQYFVFNFNDRLQILQSTDSPTGWLYLALLHAMTSHPLPDEYTGMTGMERAVELLNSAGCWTDQSFDPLSLDICYQISNISPSSKYYPEHLTCMEKISWKYQFLPYSLQHFGYYLIVKKLIDTSEKLNFMYPLANSNKKSNTLSGYSHSDTKLLEKLYWDYRDSYNPAARLSQEMEEDILRQDSFDSYRPTPIYDSSITDYQSFRLTNDMYRCGDLNLQDSSTIRCFPLSQWVNLSYEFKNVWIGLLKSVESAKVSAVNGNHTDIQRLEIFLDFLHYVAKQRGIRPMYLNMLKTVLKSSAISLNLNSFPTFGSYCRIEEIRVHRERIHFPLLFDEEKRNKILAEVEQCFKENRPYDDKLTLPPDMIIYNKSDINKLLITWQSNKTLREFLESIQTKIDSVEPCYVTARVQVDQQKFTRESNDTHHRIKLKSGNSSIRCDLISVAERKYCRSYSGDSVKPTRLSKVENQKQSFPCDIFPSTNHEKNPLSDIAKLFKNQLASSWQKFESIGEFTKEYPSTNEITGLLDSFRRESIELWEELLQSITLFNKLLFKTGLAFRTTPAILVSIFHKIWLNEEQERHINQTDNLPSRKKQKIEELSGLFLTREQCLLLGATLVNWIVEQQLQRTLYFANHKRWEDFEKEVSNTPHSNWIPSEHLPWLILELEMNITIRKVQVDVARHMMKPNIPTDDKQVKNIVMQMNMGEGKTSVIVPMLALSLCLPSSSLVRVIVLKSLLIMNYQSLRFKLGGLLNRRIFSFGCRRDMNFNAVQINILRQRLHQALKKRDIVLTSPEYILSFDLLSIDKCRRNEFDVARSMLETRQWLKVFARDILDESDEILHVKYQLIYTVGSQKEVDGSTERWKTIQSILASVKRYAADIAHAYSNEVCYKPPKRRSNFPEFRLLSHQAFPALCEKVANDWLQKSAYRQEERQLLLSFILRTDLSVNTLVNHVEDNKIPQFLILRGFLSSHVLLIALVKRYRVNYGVNQNPNFKRLMAVPFRAKDVAAENTEFGHPDIAIVLTQLFYYYKGLNDAQMLQCFNRLSEKEKDPKEIYEEWISHEDENDVDSSIKEWEGVNLKDDQQKMLHLFPSLRQNMLVVNYYVNHFVFPQEAKQFPQKLVSSAWDLSFDSRTQIITGFSGTNDTQLLLPIHISQRDLPELEKTDAVVLNNLLRPANEHYRSLQVSPRFDEILQQIVDEKRMINVILDVGALFINGTNSEIAVEWLNKSNKTKIDYGVYFNSDSIYVCDRQNQHNPFLTSPASERLERCVVYLDEAHTRGTDFKFPNGFRAVVTLGNGLTKDRLVQACMRMRKLGKTHELSFLSSNEVDQRIRILKEVSRKRNKQECIDEKIKLSDILRWVYENTQQATWDGLHHWSTQSLSFQRKIVAFQKIDKQRQFDSVMMTLLATECLEPEILELKHMYGVPKSTQTLSEIYNNRSKHCSFQPSSEINKAVLKRLNDYGGSKTLLAHSFDEEQERELEQEIEQEIEEERQREHPAYLSSHQPILHKEIKDLCNMQGSMMDLATHSSVFSPLVNAFLGTSFFGECQPCSWQKNFWISTEFQRVIQTQREPLDMYLRPPRWVLVYRNKHLIFVSPFEANWLLGQLQFIGRTGQCDKLPSTTLRLLLPRTKRNQSILVNTPTLTIPSSITTTDISNFYIPIRWLAELFVFNGSLYFKNVCEQTAYCKYLGVCPTPRTAIEEDAFDKRLISNDGFVGNADIRSKLQIDYCPFHINPLALVKKILESRNKAQVSPKSHVGAIVINGSKLIY